MKTAVRLVYVFSQNETLMESINIDDFFDEI